MKALLLTFTLFGSLGCAQLEHLLPGPAPAIAPEPAGPDVAFGPVGEPAVFKRSSEVGHRLLLGLVYELDGRVVHRTEARVAAAGGRASVLRVKPGSHRVAVGLEYQGMSGVDQDFGERHLIRCDRGGRLEIRVRAAVKERGSRVELETGLAGAGCAPVPVVAEPPQATLPPAVGCGVLSAATPHTL
jgi:hypothetical protein